jgi:hypothetical protein
MPCDGTFRDGEAGTRQCSHCNSISIADAIRLLKTPGTRFSGSDWKYGWPHKFYIEPLNPDADKIVEVGAQYDHGVRTPIMGTRKFLHFKFYNTHLTGATPEEFLEFSLLSEQVFGIRWDKDEKGIKYSCPRTKSFYGYQRSGRIGEDLVPIREL